ncbi:hypothetical protein IGS68_05350 [Skermanella sp. TT6]|uniref:Uncharacterized protein n=1 Tax=Skermanella cutis TaxID=2775420 RepID=A0ABX7B948_9PROT|nr:hypothetical protein [Skermanella sp. TT6]QQP90664.1 hypothetical protein IGS68_05350 [Skermanella sp. TT6]
MPVALKEILLVVPAPHIGGGTIEAHKALQDLVAADIAAFLQAGLSGARSGDGL